MKGDANGILTENIISPHPPGRGGGGGGGHKGQQY